MRQKGKAMRFPFAFGTCVLLLAALPAAAQDRPARDPYSAPARTGSGVIGATVTLDGRTLGRVNDVALTDTGAVRDLIVRTADGSVIVPFSEVRYDSGARAYLVTTGFKPQVVTEAPKLPARDTTSPGDRWSRGARLIRTEPVPAAKIVREPERAPAVLVVAPRPDAVSTRLQDFARAARIYGEPTASVSMTRNIDRLPARSATFDGYTLPGEAYGFRSPYRRILAPMQ